MKTFRRAPFLISKWDGRDVVLINCDTLRHFRVDDRLLALLADLDSWRQADQLQLVGHAVSETDLERLVAIGVVEEGHDDVHSGPLPSFQWNVFDLAVQRRGNTGGARGHEVLSRGAPPPPLFKPRPAGEATPLPAPIPRVSEKFFDVLARRRSIRKYGPRSVTLEELSTLLHHAAGIAGTFHSDLFGDHAFRPFPGGGGRSELEIYVVANDVAGLATGAHYFDPQNHDLVLLRKRDREQERLNRQVQMATAGYLNRDAPVVLLINAVFGRMMWKYEGIGLAVIYKDVGCLYQTLYLVATALDLAPCGIGAGQEVANSRWLGLDPLIESQVGCVLIGPRAESGPPVAPWL